MERYMRVFFILFCMIFTLGGVEIQGKVQKAERSYDWKEAEEAARNTVVQVFSQHTLFNWQEPYKAPRQTEGCGTAFFIDSQGTLLTNFHVVDQASSLHVQVPEIGQRPLEAKVVGVCPESDVALIKLTDEALCAFRKSLSKVPFLTLGDSDALFPTEPVLALGYPLGQRYLKSTVGVIAGREYIAGSSYMHITAPINPGNSGGPLLNLDGLVVGINSAGIPNSQNIGYIVPIYDAQILLKDLAKQKLVRKPDLGIRYNATTEEHAQLLGNPVPAGTYINTVYPNSIAQKMGIKEGDMLYEINGHPVDSYGDVTVNWQSSAKVTLDEFLIRLPCNEKMNVRIFRKGKEKNLKGTYSEPIPLPVRFIHPEFEQCGCDYEIIGGMCVMQLRTNHLDIFNDLIPLHQYRLAENRDKEVLIVTKLLPGSLVHKINCFYEGVLLDKVNDKPVKNLDQLRDAIKESAHTGLIAIQSKDKVATAMSVDALLKDEDRITKDFMFTSTRAIKDIKKARKDFLQSKRGASLGKV